MTSTATGGLALKTAVLSSLRREQSGSRTAL